MSINKAHLNLFVILTSTIIVVLSASGMDFQTHTSAIKTPELFIEEGTIYLEGYMNSVTPGNPCLPQKCINFVVHPDIDWSTLTVSIDEEESEILPEIYSINPVPPAIIRTIEDGKTVEEEYYGDGVEILDGKNTAIYSSDKFYPENSVELLPYSQIRKWNIARVGFYPIQYNPVSGQIRWINRATITISYGINTGKLYNLTTLPVLNDTVADKRASEIAVNFHQMKSYYQPVQTTADELNSPQPLPTSYNYIIITTNYIRTNSTKLNNYVTHKQSQYYTILVKTVEEIEAEYTRALRPELFETTDQRADRIRAFLKDKYLEYGTQWVLLIGNPTPVTGDVPMKYCDPDQYDAPTDAYYSDLTGRWDLDGDTLYGEHPDDAAAGGVDFAGPELYVSRIPNYSTSMTSLDSILQKIMTYENDMVNESWRKSCIMPNPIDGSDAYGQEGNLSPVTMVEYIKNNALIPAGFSYYRILEHKFNWYPINVTPDPEKTPVNPGHTNITYYDSTRRFKAELNTTSEDVAVYTISEMTDNSDSSYYEKTNMGTNEWLQFKQTYSDLLSANYNPDRVIIKSTSKSYLPQKFIIQMASNGTFSDAYTIVTETDASANAVADGAYWKLQYDYPTNMNNVGYRRYFRLKYTGASTQATVRINEFQVFTEQHLSIKPYVIPEWQKGYGICYYNTHGSATYAADVIDYTECSQLDNNKPSFVFSKACQNAWPENSNNLCYSLLKNGAIADLAATRTSYGLGDAGYPKLFPRLCGQNKRFGQIIAEMYSEMAVLGELGWGGLFADCMRFNLYGDPTVALRADAELDGMPYWWELHYGLNPLVDDADGDPDNDWFTNIEEYLNGTDPTVAEDDDGDGLPDGWEIYYLNTMDEDGDDDHDIDRLSNLREYQLKTNPANKNTDGDGVDDGDEVDNGCNPCAFTYYVSDLDGNDSYDGVSPSFNGTHGPKKTILQGMNASLTGEEVIVLEGTYKGAENRGLNFNGKAIVVKSIKGAYSTVIDCESVDRSFYCFGAPNPGAVIDGFTITNGYTIDRGAGIYCEESTFTIRNCVMVNNNAVGNGGGFWCRASADVNVENCLFLDNSSSDQGGGIFSAGSTILISNSTLIGNSATNYGGGYACGLRGNGTVRNTIIRGNTAANGNQVSVRNTTDPSTVTIEYSNIEGTQSGVYVMSGCTLNWGTGNIGSDPLFVSGVFGSYYLSQIASGQGINSPCLDSGSDSALNLGLDETTTRTDQGYDNGIVDMGYHYPVNTEIIITSITRSGDNVTIEWDPRPEGDYTVQWSTDMQTWNDVYVGQTGTWTDTNTVGYTLKFYRIFE